MSLLKVTEIKDECSPIKSLNELRCWNSVNLKKYFAKPLQKRKCVSNCPKTLVCHDMMGGYLKDRYIYGSSCKDNYYIIHWSMIDIFVYFSHHLVTIPPYCWISSAHQNGVKVLGTFITEWDAGKNTCDDFLSDTESVEEISHQLVRIATFFGFDGWLINIENKIEPDKVFQLKEFVRMLTVKMHEAETDSLIIWYDSVTEDGLINYQNELNERNRMFFDLCDGIFLNYAWDQDKLGRTVQEAGIRKNDVFVGVDVFGRGCFGGGGYCTNLAVTAARDHDLSVAIFAPGWVYETLDHTEFIRKNYDFWHSLVELCPVREIESLPYYTSFCPGFGDSMYSNGKVIDNSCWYNLSLQQPQPSYHYINCPEDGSEMSVYTLDAFNGGGCLQLKSEISKHNDCVYFQMLSTNFLISKDCLIEYAFKSEDGAVKVSLVLNVVDKYKKFCLNLEAESDHGTELYVVPCPGCIGESNSACAKVKATSTKIFKVDSGTAWIKRKYRLCCHATESYYIKAVGVRLSWEDTSASDVSVLLGELMISPVASEILFSYKNLRVKHDEESVELECILQWSCDDKIEYSDLYIVIDGDKNYICRTSQFCYPFKGSVKQATEVNFVLYPKYSLKTVTPVHLKVPLCLN